MRLHFLYINLISLARITPELLAAPAEIIVYYRVCRTENILGRAVILFKLDYFGVRYLVVKMEDIVYRRTAEFIYAV